MMRLNFLNSKFTNYGYSIRKPSQLFMLLISSKFFQIFSLPQPWFQSLNISRPVTFMCSRLRLGRNLFHNYSFKLGFNYSLPCCLTSNQSYDFHNLLINCPALSLNRDKLKKIFSLLSALNSYISILYFITIILFK